MVIYSSLPLLNCAAATEDKEKEKDKESQK
jgi:hypothetical protein